MKSSLWQTTAIAIIMGSILFAYFDDGVAFFGEGYSTYIKIGLIVLLVSFAESESFLFCFFGLMAYAAAYLTGQVPFPVTVGEFLPVYIWPTYFCLHAFFGK